MEKIIALSRAGLESLPSVAMIIALLLGAYLERILFFSLAGRAYFFSCVGEES